MDGPIPPSSLAALSPVEALRTLDQHLQSALQLSNLLHRLLDDPKERDSSCLPPKPEPRLDHSWSASNARRDQPAYHPSKERIQLPPPSALTASSAPSSWTAPPPHPPSATAHPATSSDPDRAASLSNHLHSSSPPTSSYPSHQQNESAASDAAVFTADRDSMTSNNAAVSRLGALPSPNGNKDLTASAASSERERVDRTAHPLPPLLPHRDSADDLLLTTAYGPDAQSSVHRTPSLSQLNHNSTNPTPTPTMPFRRSRANTISSMLNDSPSVPYAARMGSGLVHQLHPSEIRPGSAQLQHSFSPSRDRAGPYFPSTPLGADRDRQNMLSRRPTLNSGAIGPQNANGAPRLAPTSGVDQRLVDLQEDLVMHRERRDGPEGPQQNRAQSPSPDDLRYSPHAHVHSHPLQAHPQHNLPVPPSHQPAQPIIDPSLPTLGRKITPSLTLNSLGQRTCQQCLQPGRYKDGRCIEKWGPGPAGPGTVCDRCRKRMKRVERRRDHERMQQQQGGPVARPAIGNGNGAMAPGGPGVNLMDPQHQQQARPMMNGSATNGHGPAYPHDHSAHMQHHQHQHPSPPYSLPRPPHHSSSSVSPPYHSHYREHGHHRAHSPSTPRDRERDFDERDRHIPPIDVDEGNEDDNDDEDEEDELDEYPHAAPNTNAERRGWYADEDGQLRLNRPPTSSFSHSRAPNGSSYASNGHSRPYASSSSPPNALMRMNMSSSVGVGYSESQERYAEYRPVTRGRRSRSRSVERERARSDDAGAVVSDEKLSPTVLGKRSSMDHADDDKDEEGVRRELVDGNELEGATAKVRRVEREMSD